MMNLIRADFYRVSKSWVTYAPFAALLLVHAVVMIFFRSYSGGIAYVESMLLTSNLVFLIFVVPFVFCVSVPSFADSTMKNDISWGMSRTKLYLSKLLVLIMLAVLLYVFYIGSGLALATVISGGLGDTA
ncbi:MAG: hypothetical protein FWD84_06690, partial [Oscillospiraceae bacterium]|nr:hypothetical protein [Oscillospiraceae bacterium]